MQISVITKRARAGVWRVREEPARYKARINNGAVAVTYVLPQKIKTATDRASTSCEVSLQ